MFNDKSICHITLSDHYNVAKVIQRLLLESEKDGISVSCSMSLSIYIHTYIYISKWSLEALYCRKHSKERLRIRACSVTNKIVLVYVRGYDVMTSLTLTTLVLLIAWLMNLIRQTL